MDKHTVSQLAAALHRANLTGSCSVNSSHSFDVDVHVVVDNDNSAVGTEQDDREVADRRADEPPSVNDQEEAHCDSRYYYNHGSSATTDENNYDSTHNKFNHENNENQNNSRNNALSRRTARDDDAQIYRGKCATYSVAASMDEGGCTSAFSNDTFSSPSSVTTTSFVEQISSCAQPHEKPEKITFSRDGQETSWVSSTNDCYSSNHSSNATVSVNTMMRQQCPELWGAPNTSRTVAHYPLFSQLDEVAVNPHPVVPFAKYSNNPCDTPISSNDMFDCGSNLKGDLSVGHEAKITSPYEIRNTSRAIHPADLVNIDGRTSMNWSSDQNSGIAGSRSAVSASSANMTENVRVSSSFHVAEIVGKQGVKIKKIRANTNTWIKTPVRGQDPVFIVSGRQEGVEQAKAQILASNEKVSTLRELRNRNAERSMPRDDEEACSSRKTSVGISVSVPSNAVGLVIGPKGSRIRQISESTSTYIKTPCRHREPTFEIYGQPEDVQSAKEQILLLLRDKMDDEYIKHWMTQLPIHEPGSPVRPSTPVAPLSLSPMEHNYTKLRQTPTYNNSSVQPPDSHMLADMYPGELQPSAYPLPMHTAVSTPYAMHNSVSTPYSGPADCHPNTYSQPVHGGVMQVSVDKGNISHSSPLVLSNSNYLGGF